MRYFSIVILLASCSLFNFETDNIKTNLSHDFYLLSENEQIKVEPIYEHKKEEFSSIIKITTSGTDLPFELDENMNIVFEDKLITGLLYNLSIDGYLQTEDSKSEYYNRSIPFYYITETPNIITNELINKSQQSIILEFSKDISEEKFREKLTISPELDFDITVDKSRVTIDFISNFTEQSVINLNIKNGIIGFDDAYLPIEVEESFLFDSKIDEIKVTNCYNAIIENGIITPSSNEIKSLAQNESIIFELSDSLEYENIKDAINIEPNINGLFDFYSDKIFSFTPYNYPIEDNNYSISIQSDNIDFSIELMQQNSEPKISSVILSEKDSIELSNVLLTTNTVTDFTLQSFNDEKTTCLITINFDNTLYEDLIHNLYKNISISPFLPSHGLATPRLINYYKNPGKNSLIFEYQFSQSYSEVGIYKFQIDPYNNGSSIIFLVDTI